MKGYATAEGYMGYVEDEYMLFASEADYRDYIECVQRLKSNSKCAMMFGN